MVTEALEPTTWGSDSLRHCGRVPFRAMNSVPATFTDEYTTIRIDSVIEIVRYKPRLRSFYLYGVKLVLRWSNPHADIKTKVPF